MKEQMVHAAKASLNLLSALCRNMPSMDARAASPISSGAHATCSQVEDVDDQAAHQSRGRSRQYRVRIFGWRTRTARTFSLVRTAQRGAHATTRAPASGRLSSLHAPSCLDAVFADDVRTPASKKYANRTNEEYPDRGRPCA